MSSSGIWCTEREIFAACMFLRMNIVVLTPSSNSKCFSVFQKYHLNSISQIEDDSIETLFILYNVNSHYRALIRK